MYSITRLPAKTTKKDGRDALETYAMQWSNKVSYPPIGADI